MVRRENDPGEHRKLLVAGVALLTVSALLIGLSIAIYNKAFHTYTTLTLEADRAGMQLAEHGDVRYNGVLVGQVRSIRQQGDEAVIQLGLEPDSAKAIPRDIEAQILPTTLFGQKYVALVPRDRSGPTGIRSGTVLPPKRVHTSVELGRVLARLYPLLRTVQPADLSATLNALASALNGRGEAIGRSMDKLDSYLTTMNAHLPTLQEDLRLLAQVTDTYQGAAPDLIQTLANLTVTSHTITSHKDQLAGLFGSVTDVANLSTDILGANEVNIERSAHLSEPVLRVLEKYAPEYNCLLRGIAAYKPILIKTFEGGQVKQYAEFPTTQRRAYDRRDIPKYNDKRGPRCYGLPNHPWEPWPGLDLRNGTNLDSKEGLGNSYFPAGASPGPTFAQDLIGALTGQDIGFRSGSDADSRRATAAVLSTRTGRPASEIPALSTLMYSPMLHHAGGGRA